MMRSFLRWLACLSLTASLLYFLRHCSQSSCAVTEYIPFLSYLNRVVPAHSNLPISKTPDSIGALWQKWSQVMFSNKPTVPAMLTRMNAEVRRPDQPDKSRSPYTNLIRNSQSDINSMRKSHAQFLKELEKISNDEQVFNGRGAVIVGGGEYFGPAIISIHMLRRTGSTLPVEVFILNEDEYEREVCEGYLPKFGARCVLLSSILSHASGSSKTIDITHYQIKSLAMLLSSFSETLLLDSDSIPLVDPIKSLFEAEPYRTDGFVVWPDFWQATESPHFWTIAGRSEFPENLPATSSEAGQLLMNKRTHLPALLLATYYNVFGPDYYYPLLSQGALGQGDKETFMAAVVVLNSSYHRVQTSVTALGRDDGDEYKGTAMVQYLPTGNWTETSGSIRPAFLHSNTPKMNAGHLVDEGDLFKIDGTTRLRLLGSEEDHIKLFGTDVEKTIWELLVQTGCELAEIVREWEDRERLCQRLEEHYIATFETG